MFLKAPSPNLQRVKQMLKDYPHMKNKGYNYFKLYLLDLKKQQTFVLQTFYNFVWFK